MHLLMSILQFALCGGGGGACYKCIYMYRLKPASSCVKGCNQGGHSYHLRVIGPQVI